jgi:hypothetical protein
MGDEHIIARVAGPVQVPVRLQVLFTSASLVTEHIDGPHWVADERGLQVPPLSQVPSRHSPTQEGQHLAPTQVPEAHWEVTVHVPPRGVLQKPPVQAVPTTHGGRPGPHLPSSGTRQVSATQTSPAVQPRWPTGSQVLHWLLTQTWLPEQVDLQRPVAQLWQGPLQSVVQQAVLFQQKRAGLQSPGAWQGPPALDWPHFPATQGMPSMQSPSPRQLPRHCAGRTGSHLNPPQVAVSPGLHAPMPSHLEVAVTVPLAQVVSAQVVPAA